MCAHLLIEEVDISRICMVDVVFFLSYVYVYAQHPFFIYLLYKILQEQVGVSQDLIFRMITVTDRKAPVS